MKKRMKILTMAEIAIFASIGFALDLLATLYSGFFPFGGSISLAIIPIVILSFRRGTLPAILCGLIVGLLDLTDGFYTISDKWYNSLFQIGLDYIFTYMFVGLVGLAKPLIKKFNYVIVVVFSTVVAGFIKYFSHFMSGVLFWPKFENQPFLDRVIYSLSYNGSYMIPTIIVCSILMFFISFKIKKLFILEDEIIL